MGRLLVNLGLDGKRPMDMVAALLEELAGGSAEPSPAALSSRKSREAAPERTVPPEPFELTEKGCV